MNVLGCPLGNFQLPIVILACCRLPTYLNLGMYASHMERDVAMKLCQGIFLFVLDVGHLACGYLKPETLSRRLGSTCGVMRAVSMVT